MSIVRDSMVRLITQEREMINDPASVVFRDDQVQDALDRHRQEVRFASLRPGPTFSAQGVAYQDYYSDLQNWEDDALFQDVGYADVTAAVATYESLVGHWTFAAPPAGIALRITGKVYDLHASAADLLLAWAGRVALEFTFSTDGQKFDREGQFRMLTELAQFHRGQAMPRSVRIVQSDAAPDVDGGGIVYPNLDSSWGGAW